MRFPAVKGNQRDNQKAEEDLLSRLVEPEAYEQRAQLGHDETSGGNEVMHRLRAIRNEVST